MENDIENLLILTIVIQTHGKVINFDLDTRTANIFDNVRLLCKAGDFVDYETTPIQELELVGDLKGYFTHDLDEATYDTIKKAKSGALVDNITYDKSLSIMLGDPGVLDYIDPVTYLQGIYLLSIHKGRKLIYPLKGQKIINFMKLQDINTLASFFNTKVPNINDLSTPFPSYKIYLNEEEMTKKNKSLSEVEKERKTEEIRRQFFNNLQHWQLTIEGNKIMSIKLSTLVELVKAIIGKQCFINLLDYSCNSATMFIPKEQKTLSQYALKEGDIEMGIDKKSQYGGRKRRHRKTKKNNKYKKNKSRRIRKLNKRFH
jgi:hypothetical protein